MVVIIDYGMGNVGSVKNAFASLGEEAVISRKEEDIKSASHIVLPGVGAFKKGMENIHYFGLVDILRREVLEKQKPFLGICLGMQLLAEKGYEFGEHDGLGWIQGEAVKLDAGKLPLPHIGWNNIHIARENKLLKDVENDQDFYFVHSYVFKTKNSDDIAATTEYGSEFNSVISKNNIFGVQFHPEKSQRAGKLLLENFLKLS